jgi:glycosyltransferase involved in cell wall biosynthesis
MLKIGLLGVEDPASILSFSGIPYHLGEYLRRAGNEVRVLGPYSLRYATALKLWNKLRKRLIGSRIVWERHPLITRQYPMVIQQYIDRNPEIDVLLATSAFYLGKTKVRKPLIFWGDTTVAGVVGQYPNFRQISARTIAQCHAVEQDALTACDLALFSNRWAAEVALANYQLDPRKVHVLTFGPCLLRTPTEAEIRDFLPVRPIDRFNLLIMAVDWHRKGVDKAIEISTELRRRGLAVTLTVTGCKPPKGKAIPEHVQVTGKILKASEEGFERFWRLMSESHLLILPTRAECAAVVLAEASAFGMPCVASDVGGNSSLVKNGVNGQLLDPNGPVADWADAVESVLCNRHIYEDACRRAYRYFEAELSWPISVHRFEELVRSTLLGEAQETVEPAAVGHAIVADV